MTEKQLEVDDGASEKDATLSRIARIRSRKEEAGILYKGVRFRADTAGRQHVNETIGAAERHEAIHGAGTWATNWKGADGWLDNCTLADLIAVRDLGVERRQAFFAHERALSLAVLAGDNVDLNSGWPE